MDAAVTGSHSGPPPRPAATPPPGPAGTTAVPAGPDPAGWAPVVARDEDLLPRLGLTLVLVRRPALDEGDLAPLVLRGVFAMTVDLEPPRRPPDDLPAFVRRGRLRLVRGGQGKPVAEVDIAGTALTGVLDASVGTEGALALLHAVLGDAPPDPDWEMSVEHDLELLGEATLRTVRLEGRWVDVWDVLDARAGLGRRMSAEGVVVACRRAVEDGTVTVTVDGAVDGAGVATDAAVELLRSAAAFLLREADPASANPGDLELLRRPSPLMPLQVEEQRTVTSSTRVRGRTPLADVLADALDGSATELFDRVVRLVAVDPAATGTPVPVVPVPRLARAPGGSRSAGFRARDDLGVFGGRVLATPLLLNDAGEVATASAVNAYEVLMAKPDWSEATVVGPVLSVVGVDDQPQPGPIVGGAEDVLLVDRVDAAKRWWLPAYRLRVPEPGAAPATSPFLFSVATLGVVSGPVPTVGLDATIRLTVDQVMGEATRAALDALGGPAAEPVTPTGLTVSLEVPYRLEGSGETQFHVLTGEVATEADGGLVLTVRALDQLARLCYGSLAYPGFQAQPPAVVVRYSFEAWSRSGSRGRRSAGIRDGGKVALGVDRLVGIDQGVLEPHIKTKPGTLPWNELPKKYVNGDLDLEPVTVVPAATWTSCSVGHAERVPAVLPCADNPELYRQAGAGADRAIGCQDALRLGSAPPAAYAEVSQVASPARRVFRSLEQPARFVVLPAAFRITRRGPDGGAAAYRPSILVNAALGGPDGDRYVLTANLAPAISLADWLALRRSLRGVCPPGVEPQLLLPLDPTVQAGTEFLWTLPAEVAVPTVTRTWEGFQVAVSTKLAEGLLLNGLLESSGISGQVQFTLGGGTTFTSSLVLDTDVVGPWLGSPVTVSVHSGQADVVNHSERTADVVELQDDGGFVAAPVQRPVPPGATTSVAVPPGSRDLVAVHRLQPGALTVEQLSTYVADVSARLAVLNLVHYANHALARLDVDARTRDGHVASKTVEEGGTADLDLTFPLTAYLSARLVDLRVHQTFTDGHSEATPWFPWDLAAAGNVVSLTPQLIGLTPPS